MTEKLSATRIPGPRTAAENAVVEAALAFLAGKDPGPWYGEGVPSEGAGDFGRVLRFVRIVDGKGRRPLAYLEANPLLCCRMVANSRQHARAVMSEVEAWCRRECLPPFIEVFSPAIAHRFLRDLASRRRKRTVENYLGVLRRVWDHAIEKDIKFVAGSQLWRGWRRLAPMRNPWRLPETLPPDDVKPKRERPKGRPLARRNANSLANLKKGPEGTRKQADRAAGERRQLINEMRRKGMGPYAIAKELTAMGHSGERGGRFTTTAVIRLLQRQERLGQRRIRD